MNSFNLRNTLCLFLLLFCSQLISQNICFDGNYCPFPGSATEPADPTMNACGTATMTGDEYENVDFILDPGTDIGAGGTCDILQLFVDYEPDGNVYLSFVQANQGQACYSFYFDTDCDPTTGSTEDLLDPSDGIELTAQGAEIRFLVCVQQDNVNSPEVETWDGSGWVSNGANTIQGLAGLTDGCSGVNEAFVETQIPIDDLLDVCNPETNCGTLNLTTFLTFAGGSFNSQECDITFESIDTEVPAVVMADLAPIDPACTGNEITLDASGSSGSPILVYEWDLDNDGMIDQTTNTPTLTTSFANPGVYTVTVFVSDPNSICPDIEPDSATIMFEICGPSGVVCPPSPVTVLEGDPIDPATLGEPTVTTSNCNPTFELDFEDSSAPGGCELEEIITRVFTITDACGESECIQIIDVIDVDPPVIDAVLLPAAQTCFGEDITLDASGSTGFTDLTYEWDFDGDGSVDQTTTTPTVTTSYPTPGTYTVNVTVSAPNSPCPLDPASATIDVVICDVLVVVCPDSPLEVDEGQPNGPIILGEPMVTPTACNPNFDITFEDTVGDGGCDFEEIITRVFTITDACGMTECMQTINVIDIDPPMLDAVLAPGDPTCFGQDITLDASGSIGFADLTYEWDFDGNGTIDQTTTSPIVNTSYPLPGTYTVFVTVSAPTSPCPIPSATTSVEIIICDQITVTCPPSEVTVIDGEPIGSAILGLPEFTTNECNLNPLVLESDMTAPATCPLEEIITRTFTITDNCGDQTCIQTINIEIDNPAEINAQPPTPEICLGSTVTLNASASIGDGLSYCWDVGIGTVGCDYTTATAVHTYTAPGIYTISLMITDQFGCTDEKVIGTVTVYEAPDIMATVNFDPCTLTLTYDASGSIDNFPPDNLIYIWDFGDGSTSGLASGTHVFENCAVASTITVTVVDPDVPFAACSSDGQVFTVETDTEPPVVVCPPPTELLCGDPIPIYSSIEEFEIAGGTITDNCDNLRIEIVSQDTIPGLCPYIYEVQVIYVVSDLCNNSTQCTQVYNLLPDLPSVVLPEDMILSCGDDVSPAVTGIPEIVETICTRPATLSMVQDITSGSCPGDATITRTWTIVDDCGNEVVHIQTITIINDVEPTLEGPPDLTIDCLDACDPSATGGIAVAVDFCMPIDGTVNEVTITYTDEYVGFDGTVYQGNIVGFIIRTFVGTDLCGNEGIYVQTISIMRSETTVLTCNDQINVSLAPTCDGITPDFLLEAPEDTKYFISLEDGQFGIALGPNVTFDSIDWSVYIEAMETVQYTITDFCGNTCWGNILIESNLIPEFESPCTQVSGQIVSSSGEINSDDELELNDMISINEDPGRTTDYIGSITLSDNSCQTAFVIGSSKFRYNAAPHGASLNIQYVNLELYFVDTSNGTILPYTFPTGTIGVTALDDIVNNPGTYDVFVAASDYRAIGEYSIHVEVTGCIPTCSILCGGDYPPEFLTADEILDSLDQVCYATLIGDIIVESSQSGDMCSGIVHVETFFGLFKQHGQNVKEEILTQTYIELPIDLNDFEIVGPSSVELECSDDYSPDDIFQITEDGTQAYPYYLDLNNIKIDSICLEEVVIHYDVAVDTVQEMVSLDGVWVLLDIVKKEKRDSVRCLRKGPNPDAQFQEILLDTNKCNVIIDYTDGIIEACAGGQKIIREWAIIDWCAASSQVNFTQFIEVKDTKKPVIEKWDDVVISIDPWTCHGTYRLPDLDHTDDCDPSLLTESWQVSEGVILEGYATQLWISEEPIEVYLAVSDDCGNTSLDTFNILVEDHIAPVPVCKDNLTVTLTSAMLVANDGTGKIYAHLFDAGSHDSGCVDEVHFEVRRVEGCCSSECVPVYECSSTDSKTGACIDSIIVDYTTVHNDFVKFCCDDVGDFVMVELKITDKVGNFNTCMVQVLVEDKTQTNITCEPVTVGCLDDLDAIDGPGLIGQFCESHTSVQFLNQSDITGNCGLQQVIREWYIDRDVDGEFSSGDPYCQQIITIESDGKGLDPYSIKWPQHYTGEIHIGHNLECNDDQLVITPDSQIQMGDVQLCDLGGVVSEAPVWCDSPCSLIAHSVKADTIFTSDACYKLINRWTIIDWCLWEANGSNADDGNDTGTDEFIAIEDWAQGVCQSCPGDHTPLADPVYFVYESVNEDGYYTYDQVIKVVDDSAPVITVNATQEVSTSGGATSKNDATSCTGEGTITATAVDFCNGVENAADRVNWSVRVERGELIIDIQTGAGSSMTVNTGEGSPGDVHIITWTLIDGCGNETEETTEVTFADELSPSPLCISGLTTSISANEQNVDIWAPDMDLGSYDNCTDYDDLQWALVLHEQDPILPGQDGFDDQFGLSIACDSQGSLISLDVWIFDASGNGDFCTTSILVDQPSEPDTECYETTVFNYETCAWDITGDQPEEPATGCYETATFNHATCAWVVSADQPSEPDTECYETAIFNEESCEWIVSGDQPTQPNTNCYETASFNSENCDWVITGSQAIEPDTECYETATFSNTSCEWVITGDQPTVPDTECDEIAIFNNDTCAWDITQDPTKENCDVEQGGSAHIAGKVSSLSGDPIDKTSVVIYSSIPEFPKTDMVDQAGEYSFQNNPFGFNYSIRPEKDVHHVNGVSTFDILLIQRHILGFKLFDSPYQFIAADVTNDQEISSVDIVESRKLILGFNEVFPNNLSWRFSYKDHQFVDEQNPWPFTETSELNIFNEQTLSEDFVGIKVGDVNGDALANEFSQVTTRYQATLGVQMSIDEQSPHLLNVNISNDVYIEGFQFALAFQDLTMTSLHSSGFNLKDDHYKIDDNELRISWHNETSEEVEKAITFQLQFDKALSDKDIQQFQFAKSHMKAEAYLGKDMVLVELVLDIPNQSSKERTQLSQNWPNPFGKTTEIEFTIPNQENGVELIVRDAHGRIVWSKIDSYQAGTHRILLNAIDLGATGIYTYTLKTIGYTKSRRMIFAE